MNPRSKGEIHFYRNQITDWRMEIKMRHEWIGIFEAEIRKMEFMNEQRNKARRLAEQKRSDKHE